MSRNTLPAFFVLCLLPLCAHAEVADKLPTVHGLWVIAFSVGCVFGAAAFGIAYRARWPWLAVAVPCLALLAAVGPATESDIAAFAEQELGAGYLAQAEGAEWLLPLIATFGVFGGAVARRRRAT